MCNEDGGGHSEECFPNLKGELTLQKIYKVEYSFSYKEQECQTTIGYFQKREDAEEFMKNHSKEYGNDRKYLINRKDYRIEEIEVN